MKKTINQRRATSGNLLLDGIVLTSLFAASIFFGVQNAYAMIDRQLDFGSTGSEVTELQTYLSTNANIYPSGLVTGYFGALTQAGVERFQTAQGIVSGGTPETTGYGRVGPQTMLRINLLMGSPVSFDAVPVLSNPSVQYGSNSATFTWTTNEMTQGQLYYDTSPLQTDESTGPRQQPYVSGILAPNTASLQTNHSVTVSNLQSNTLYYYLTRGIDSVGNMSMTWPSSFRTNQ